jgi:hypothetical protein
MKKWGMLSLLFAAAACNMNEGQTEQQKKDSLARIEQQRKDSVNQMIMADTANFSEIQWIDSVKQDVGKVTAGGVVDITWKFRNSGTKPLVITNVTPGCGCTLAEKPTEPIAPGGEGKISAKFDTKSQSVGPHTKSVTVQANTKQNAYYLEFTATVTPQ